MTITDFKRHLETHLDASIITDELSHLEAYSGDESGEPAVVPKFLLFPRSIDDIQIIMTAANDFSIPVTVRAAGSGKTGGAIPLEGGVVLSIERLNKIVEIDTENEMAVVEPFVITGELQAELILQGLYYPPDPASSGYCTIGGNVAENAGGPSGYKYGVTGDYVIGLKGVLPTGDRFDYGGKQLKNVAGYDLISLMVGSEGTLGIITEITLRLRPYPKYRESLYLCFDDYDRATAFLQGIHRLGLCPVTAEFIDETCFEALEQYEMKRLPFPKATAVVILSCDNQDHEALEKEIQQCLRFAEESNVDEVLRLSDQRDLERLWEMRSLVSPALGAFAEEKVSEDIVVPPNKISAYLGQVKDLGRSHGVTILGFGHLGDGNIHVNILKLPGSDFDWVSKKEMIIEQVLKIAVDLGGSITGEHGVGLSKKPYLSLMFTERDIAIMRGIKSTFDPNGILNPGKIF